MSSIDSPADALSRPVIISAAFLVAKLERGELDVEGFFAAIRELEDSLPRHGALRFGPELSADRG